MSRLEELINKLCPDGVEYKKLSEVVIYDGLKQISAKDLEKIIDNTGNIKLLPSSRNYDWVCSNVPKEYSQYVYDEEVITVGRARNANTKYCNGKFISAQNHIIRSKDKSFLRVKYLYYFIKSNETLFYETEGSYPIFTKSIFMSLEIPVPPLPIQEEIVRILDSFTELTARKKQYEYYRDELIEKTEGRKAKLIDMLIQPVTDGPHTTPKLFSTGVPFVSATAIYDGKVHLSDAKGFISYEFDKECSKKYKPTKNDVFMVKSGSTTGKVAFVDFDESFNIWSPIAAMRTNKDNLPRFLFHLLHTSKVQEQVLERMSHGSQPNLSMRVMEKFDVCIPSLSEQQRIVDILDRFDTLCNDISTGLPAEIEARQKQYEYYRDKLLTFKRLEVNK